MKWDDRFTIGAVVLAVLICVVTIFIIGLVIGAGVSCL